MSNVCSIHDIAHSVSAGAVDYARGTLSRMWSSGFCSGRIVTTVTRLWLIATFYFVILFLCFIYYRRDALAIIAVITPLSTFNNGMEHEPNDTTTKTITDHGPELMRSRGMKDNQGEDFNGTARGDTDIADHVGEGERPKHQDGSNKTARQPRMFVTAIGQLGNNMFQIAAVTALARHTGHIPTLDPDFNSLLRCFPNLHIQVGVASPSRSVVHEAAFAKFYPSLEQKISSNDTAICCFFQSWKYFSGYFEEIRAIFSFSPVTIRVANETLKKVRQQHPGSQLVGVHVRRMSRPDDYKYSSGYVVRAMEYFRRKYKKVHFVICGLEGALRWSKQFLTSSDVTFVVQDNYIRNAAVDMALLSSCDHMIMTVGTYSWWAAFLGDPGRDVVYFPQPYVPNSTLGKAFSAKDHFLPGWIPIW